MSEPEFTADETRQLREVIDRLGRTRVAERLHIADATLANIASGGKSRGVTRAVIRALLPAIVREIDDATSNGVASTGENKHGTLPHS